MNWFRSVNPIADVASVGSWLRAFLRSTIACIVCVVLFGVLFLPAELSRWKQPERHCNWCARLPNGTIISHVVEMHGAERVSGRSDSIHVKSVHAPGSVTSSEIRGILSAALDDRHQRMFVVDYHGEIHCASLRDSPLVWSGFAKIANGEPCSITCSRDGKTLVLLTGDELYAWSIDPAVPEFGTLRWRQDASDIHCLAGQSDGLSLICGRHRAPKTELIALNLVTGEIGPVQAIADGIVVRIEINPDGRVVAAVANDGRVFIWQRRHEPTSWEQLTISGIRSGVTGVACFSPNGELLLTSDEQCRQLVVWDLTRQTRRSQFGRHENEILGGLFLDRGRVLSWGMDDQLRVWNLDGSEMEHSISL